MAIDPIWIVITTVACICAFVLAVLYFEGGLEGLKALWRRHFGKAGNTPSASKSIPRATGQNLWIEVDNEEYRATGDPKERKGRTNDPLIMFSYIGPTGTEEHKEVPWLTGWEWKRTRESISGRKYVVRILDDQGSMTADKITIRNLQSTVKNLMGVVVRYERRLGISMQDSVTKSIYAEQQKHAIETAASVMGKVRKRREGQGAGLQPERGGEDEGDGEEQQ